MRVALVTVSVCLLGVAPVAFAQSDGGQITGTVTDSIHRRPLASATIIATPASIAQDSVFHSALSDGRGRFTMRGLRPGRYALTVEHPYIDSIGIGALPRDVEVAANGSQPVALSIPSASTLRQALCPAAARDTTFGVVLGTVHRLDRTLAPGAMVVFTWGDFDVNPTTGAAIPKQLSASVVADSLGVFRACGLPVARTLLIQAQAEEGAQTGVIEEQIDPLGVLVRDFHLATQLYTLPDTAAAPAPRDSAAPLGRFVITGRVVSTSAKPIGSAQVRLYGTSHGTTTNDAGEFRLNGLPGGTQGVEIAALGYYPRRMRVEVGETADSLVIRLEKTAVVLDSVRVVAERTSRLKNPFYKEFNERMKVGMGSYVTEEEIDKKRPIETSDLFRMMPGFGVSNSRSSKDVAILNYRNPGGPCPLQVFVDGMEVSVTDVNTVSPAAIHGIEAYSLATAPAKYHVKNCGALFIWTK
jgi:Carboxypeptidase regulatory-like domain/TonB-dependent Receptor Plug Domain